MVAGGDLPRPASLAAPAMTTYTPCHSTPAYSSGLLPEVPASCPTAADSYVVRGGRWSVNVILRATPPFRENQRTTVTSCLFLRPNEMLLRGLSQAREEL